MKSKRTDDGSGGELPKWKEPGFDPAPYMEHLDDTEMSDAQKIEVIKAMRTIMEHFVNSAFDGTPNHFVIARKHRESRQYHHARYGCCKRAQQS